VVRSIQFSENQNKLFRQIDGGKKDHVGFPEKVVLANCESD
jgi:hypothetical protein